MVGKLTVFEFLNYLRAFNAANYVKQHEFYAENVQMVLPDPRVGVLIGKDGIRAHYAPIHADARETVIPIIVLSDRGRIYLQMDTYFQYFSEVQHAIHNYHVIPGDVIRIRCAAMYELNEDGKMTKITCYLFEQDNLGQVDLKEKIIESENKADADLKL